MNKDEKRELRRKRLMGMIPFFVGDIIDFFHRANIQNMQMIQGFVDGEETIIKQVNQRAWQPSSSSSFCCS